MLQENESKDYEGILWKNSNNLKVAKGDTVYIYYTNLPDRINRILLKCIVIDVFEKGKNEKCFYYNNNEEKKFMEKNPVSKIPGIKLKFENALCVEKGKDKFSEENLINKYGIKNFQGKQHLKEDVKQLNKETGKEEYCQKNLIDDLNKEKQKYTLERLKDYMNKISECTLQNCQAFRNENHTTFIRENGLNYYEQHHLIQQFNRRNNNFPKEIIDNPINLITLCPNCHRKIHNGRKSDKEKMVEWLYNKNKEEYDKLLSIIPEIKNGEKTAKEWIIEQYNVEKQDKDI